MSIEKSLGSCCCCGDTRKVRNIVMLPRVAPVPGTGWGCVVCGLPNDGAVFAACDRCVHAEARPREVVFGFASDRARVPIESLSAEPFEHRQGYHEDD